LRLASPAVPRSGNPLSVLMADLGPSKGLKADRQSTAELV